jgi:hypothetical protein
VAVIFGGVQMLTSQLPIYRVEGLGIVSGIRWQDVTQNVIPLAAASCKSATHVKALLLLTAGRYPPPVLLPLLSLLLLLLLLLLQVLCCGHCAGCVPGLQPSGQRSGSPWRPC